MKKNILKTLALPVAVAMTMFTVSCSNDDEIMDEVQQPTEKTTCEIPVTINVTRADGDAETRANFNSGSKKLEFTDGDKLFIKGYVYVLDFSDDMTNYNLAGVLTISDASTGTFTGSISVWPYYDGTFEELIAEAWDHDISATLLPKDYTDYGYLAITGTDEDRKLVVDASKAIVTAASAAEAKKLAVEQFSLEQATEYSSGFALTPKNAIVSNSITGLTAGTSYTMGITDGTCAPSCSVTADGSGNVYFGAGFSSGTKNISLGNPEIGALSIGSKTLTAGKIYNINRAASAFSALTPVGTMATATTSHVGKVIDIDGNIYESAYLCTMTGKTPVAIVAYVGGAGSADASSSAYKGLALALADVNNGAYYQWGSRDYSCLTLCSTVTEAIADLAGIEKTNTLCTDGHTHAAATNARNFSVARPAGASQWFLPSFGQWNKMAKALTNTGTDLSNTINSSLQTSAVSAKIIAAGCVKLSAGYYSTSESSAGAVWMYDVQGGRSFNAQKNTTKVRACFAF